MRVFLKAFLLFAVCAFFVTACGSDSGSDSVTPSEVSSDDDDGSEGDVSEKGSKDNSGSKENGDSKDKGGSANSGTSTKDAEVDSKATDEPVIISSVKDSYSGDSIKTVQVGRYIWMAQNVSHVGWSVTNVCYDKDESNCEKYGALIDTASAGFACPSGFFIPTMNDWRWLSNYSSKYPEVMSALQMQYGGYCSRVQDSLVCNGLDDYGKYMAQDGIAKLYPMNMKPTSETADFHDFYLLRCVNYTYIVESVKDLPTCDSVSKETLKPFYVVNEKSNYKCLGNRWEDDFTDDCGHVINRTAATFNDTMYICKYKEWQVADVSDAREECTSKNDSTTLLFNGKRYACENGYWRAFSEIEEKLGYCRGKMIGAFDTLKTRTDTLVKKQEYICDTNGWRLSEMTDHVGFCDSLRVFDEVKYSGRSYVCRSDRWETFSTLENEIGVCSPKKNKVIDSTESGSTYICDSTSWRYTVLEDFIGICDSTIIGTIKRHAGAGYLCKARGWNRLSDLENEIGACYETVVGTLAKTDAGVDYVCASSGWTRAAAADIGGVCDSTKRYKTVKVSGVSYYCTGYSWSKMNSIDSALGFCTENIRGKIDSIGAGATASRYSCEWNGWTKLSDLDFRFGICNTKNDSTKKVVHDSVYVCSKNTWKLGSLTDMYGVCDSLAAGKTGTFMGTAYGCRKKAWTKMSDFEIANGFCSEKNAGENIKVGSEYYECTVTSTNIYWKKTNEFKYVMGECPKDTTFRKTYKDTLYKCSNAKWNRVTINEEYGYCEQGSPKKTVVFNKQEYICDYGVVDVDWHRMTTMDSLYGVCDRTRYGDTATYKNNHYFCNTNRDGFIWDYASYRQYMGQCTSAREGHEMFNGFNTSKCTSGKWVAIVNDNMTDSRDGKKYKMVTVKGLKWMVQDLNYVTTSSDTSWAMNSRSDARLYSWTAAKKSCPSGWRLPTKTEWSTFRSNFTSLYDYGGESGMLAGNWSNLNGYTADDFFGVAIYPTGYMEDYLSGGYSVIAQQNGDNGAYFWASDGSLMTFGQFTSYPRMGGYAVGAAIRCVKD